MRTGWLVVAFLVISGVLAPSGTLLDRTVATVDGQVILLSDWEEELRFECFMSGRAVEELSPSERRAALERLIDQELVKEQMPGVQSAAPPEEIERQTSRLKGEFAQPGARESWQAVLARYGLSEKIVRNHLALEVGELRLIDLRFRPSVAIGAQEIDNYYRQRLLPRVPASAAPSLSQASEGIRKVLTEEKINQMLASWLESLRRQARIRISSGDKPGQGELK
jgi:hypothetical protein